MFNHTQLTPFRVADSGIPARGRGSFFATERLGMTCQQCNLHPADGQYIRDGNRTVCLPCFYAGTVAVEAREHIAAAYLNAARALEDQAALLRKQAEQIKGV